MRRKIELYIGGRLADLDDQGIILYNYAFTELQEPSVVKNSYSKQVKLPATPRNLAIFGHPDQVTRKTVSGSSTTGVYFNPGEKTPFELRDEMNNIVESGYVRLDSVVVKSRTPIGIKITLFGGIGSFFYDLSYKSNGDKMTLADLNYSQIQLQSFTIDASTVRTAWTRLRNHSQASGINQQWDVLNFAPAYNGIPSTDFDAKKALIIPADMGLPNTVNEDGVVHTLWAGRSLLNLKEERDEWAMKDLRSYLQRPVLSMKAFMEAIADTSNYNVDYSAVPAALYTDVWKTLPTIPDLKTLQGESGSGSVTYTHLQEEGAYFAELQIAGVPPSANVAASIAVTPNWKNGAETTPTCFRAFVGSEGGAVHFAEMLFFIQAVLMDGEAMVGASQVKVLCNYEATTDGSALASAVGFTPWVPGKGFSNRIVPAFNTATSATEDFAMQSLSFYISGNNGGSSIRIYFRAYLLQTHGNGEYETIDSYTTPGMGALTDDGTFCEAQFYSLDGYSGSFSYSTSYAPRSGATIDPLDLLQSAHTPAEYLISFCKINGLIFGFNPATKTVTIMPRNSWFSGQITDLSGRVDTSREITIKPLSIESKWYDLKTEMVEGAFAQQYEALYGRQYGSQRVNTGYDFDAAAKDMFSGLAFKGAVSVLDSSPYWNMIFNGDGDLLPSPLIDKEATYTLWTPTTRESEEYQVPSPSVGASITYYNTTDRGYDKPWLAKLEFRDADNKPVSGEDVLCRYVGSAQYAYFALTDDSAVMFALNDGVPCWDLTGQTSSGEYVPIFGRYNDLSAASGVVSRSFDFGIPAEVKIPGVTFSNTTGSVYLRSWRAYLTDLLGIDTKVMKCRVDLGGIQVGQQLLRNFYWYEGSLWVLNKITNYSLTTWDPTECEFVQVQDMSNYTNGQNL